MHVGSKDQTSYFVLPAASQYMKKYIKLTDQAYIAQLPCL